MIHHSCRLLNSHIGLQEAALFLVRQTHSTAAFGPACLPVTLVKLSVMGVPHKSYSGARLLPPVKIIQKANSIRVRSTSLINSLIVPRHLCRRFPRSRCRLPRGTPRILRALPGQLQEYCNSPLQRRLFRTLPLRRDSALHHHTPTGQWRKLTSTGGKPTSHVAWLAFLALRDTERC